MPALAPGQTGRLAVRGPLRGAVVPRIRAATRLGFFVGGIAACLAASGCAGHPSTGDLAAAAGRKHRTEAFAWLLGHEPAALVAWRIDPSEVRAIIPNAHIDRAAARPCAQAKAEHAVLLLVAGLYAAADRDRAEDCGFALYRDGGALVIAPR
jgi:hypothetical protein